MTWSYHRAGSQRVVSLSRDNTIKIWDGKRGLSELASFHHNNNTGRWTTTFRAVWGPASDCVIAPSMGRMVRHPFAWAIMCVMPGNDICLVGSHLSADPAASHVAAFVTSVLNVCISTPQSDCCHASCLIAQRVDCAGGHFGCGLQQAAVLAQQ